MSDYLASPQGVVECLYAAISFAAGQQPNYNLMHALFHPQARITPPASDTGNVLRSLNVDAFFEHFDGRIQDIISVGGREEQVSSKTVIFHRIAHVFSAYHFISGNSEKPMARGVNSLQLVHENGRWWILSLTWDRAEAGELLPSFSE